MIDIEKVKSKILTLAFQGKLIPFHITQENTALETLHSITKNYNPVSESEQLIETSDHWQWSRLGYVCNNHGQIVPDSSFCYIDVGSIDNKQHCLSSEEKIIEAKNAPSRARKIVYQNDVIYSTVRPYLHNICLIDRPFSKKPIASTAFCVLSANKDVLNNRFLYYWLLTTEFDRYSNGDPSKGALYPAIGEKDLLFGAIPIPPIEEQQEIVKKIDSSFALLNSIYDLQNKHFTNCVTLKSKLIDAAIQGKLTEQLPGDGTAVELYELVQQERKSQETLGLIKHEELSRDVSDEEIPFSIPDSWCWTHLGNVSYIVRGGSPRPIKQYITQEPNGINWIKIGDVEKGEKYIYQAGEKIKPEGEKKSRRVRPGDFLLTNSMSFGRPYISQIEGCIHDGWLLIRNLKSFDTDYLYYLLSSNYLYNQFIQKASGSTVDNLNIDKVKSAIIPFPPLAEQKRIVARLEELLPLCE